MNYRPDADPESTVWLHYHVPKTGGQTIRSALIDQLEIGFTYVHLTPASSSYAPRTNDELAKLSQLERRLVRVAGGHAVSVETRQLFEGRSIHELVVLRDPAQRLVSLYNYNARQSRDAGHQPRDFESWYGARPRNAMVHFLGKRFGIRNQPGAVAERLAECNLVGDTKDMDRWLPYLLRQLRLPDDLPPRTNVTGVDHEQLMVLDDELSERIARDHPGEVELMERIAPVIADHLQRAEQNDVAPATDRGRPVQVTAVPPETSATAQHSKTDAHTNDANRARRPLSERLTAPAARRWLQLGAVLAWTISSILVIATRSSWSVAVAAITAGLIGLATLKIALVAAVTADQSQSHSATTTNNLRGLAQQLEARTAIHDPAEVGDIGDIGEALFAHRLRFFEIEQSILDDAAHTADRIKLIERMVEPILAANEAQHQELLALREQVARTRSERGS